MQTFTYEIRDPMGLHARPAGELVKMMRNYQSKAVLSVHGKTAESTRLISLMTLCARQGETLTVTVEGPDEAECAEALRQFLSGTV